ncbi:asparaginase [Macrolepiota fuliginosa MF-IS2]|uniref:Asparaginase n=1 Tax=Macrolepiota fuliginosa MF-IS2 TaxID=1400762 RepID=A0A9P5XI11_9AGAR|nr:asparaginase [Macrolepiota fuliginosa MF-IS2]
MVTSEKSSLLPVTSLPVKGKGKSNYVLVIHGGAGTITREGSSPKQRADYRKALRDALEAGYNVLRDGGEALDAVVAAVTVMEDCPLFNAGKGAVFNVAGKNELEASIMLSKPPASHPHIPPTRRGVSATLLTKARNPSQLIRALYLAPDRVPHPLVSGSTAEEIAASLGETLVDPSYFFTERRWREHREGLGLPEEPLPYPPDGNDTRTLDQLPKGTVGAVALDIRGCIATLTSTGGRTNKLVGRIGDTPHMGSGFWAEEWKPSNSTWLQKFVNMITRRPMALGVSGTGDGDYFIRLATASTIARRVQLKHQSIKKAGQIAVDDLLHDGGLGGVIILDSQGHVAMPMNSPGMYRGVIRNDGVPLTAIFFDEEVA